MQIDFALNEDRVHFYDDSTSEFYCFNVKLIPQRSRLSKDLISSMLSDGTSPYITHLWDRSGIASDSFGKQTAPEEADNGTDRCVDVGVSQGKLRRRATKGGRGDLEHLVDLTSAQGSSFLH